MMEHGQSLPYLNSLKFVLARRDVVFFSLCRARSRLGRSLKRLVVDQLFSRCKRTGELLEET